MANTKKYVSLDKLSLYDEKIKKVISDGDAAALASAKSYADGLAVNYDAAGAAATAEANAKAYADGKDAAIAEAKKAGTDAAAAAAVADGKAVAAQGEVDALETYVGTFTHDTAKSVVEYINAKTDGIATSGNLEALGTRVTAVEGDVATIKGDYLKGADKTELEGKITGVQTAVDNEKTRAEGIEAGLESRLAAVEGDYLKNADKTALEQSISANASAIELLTNGVSAEEVDGVNDLIQYVKDHGTEVTGMKKDISDNAAAIAAEATTARAAEQANATAAANAQSAAEAAAAAVETEKGRAEGVESGLDTRLKAVEAKFGDGDGNVEDMIADAKQAAIDAAAADATSKANTAEGNAKTYADGLNTSMNTRVEALEAVDHDHANKAELDLIASGDKAKWDAAAAKAHEHSNLSVLEGITAAKVAAWDAAEGNAKTYADGLNTSMNTRVEALETWHNNFTEVSEDEINALFA